MNDGMLQISLKAARVNAGLSQIEAAKHFGISISTIIKWEKHPEVIPAWRQAEISSIYNMPISNIIFLPRD